MEIKINKDIQEYRETIAFGLDLRQFIFSIFAVACGAGVYILLFQTINASIAGWIAVIAAVPGALLGFFKINDLTFEKFLFAFIKVTFLFPQTRTFCTPETRERLKAEADAKKKPKKAKKKDGGKHGV